LPICNRITHLLPRGGTDLIETMTTIFGTTQLLFLDARADPVNVVSWGPLLLLLAIVFILAVSFAAALVVLLIWLKRRKVSST
jgi:hypothetical protein